MFDTLCQQQEQAVRHESATAHGALQVNDSENSEQPHQPQPPVEVAKIEANGQNGNLTAQGKQEITTLEPGEIKKEKKGTGVMKSSKKIESKSTSTENIKCTTYTCPICKKVVMKRGLFKAHLETHKTDHKFACDICMRV